MKAKAIDHICFVVHDLDAAVALYRDTVRGFGVRFQASDQRRALAYAMGVPDALSG